MITKKEVCICEVNKFCEAEGILFSDLNENHISMSSTLAVAMEYLGLIKTEELREYAERRGGTVYLYIDPLNHEPKALTFRELLDLLPDTM